MSINLWTDKEYGLQPYKESNTKEYKGMKYDICYYMGEPQNHAYQRKLHSKHHVLYDSIHVKCPEKVN